MHAPYTTQQAIKSGHPIHSLDPRKIGFKMQRMNRHTHSPTLSLSSWFIWILSAFLLLSSTSVRADDADENTALAIIDRASKTVVGELQSEVMRGSLPLVKALVAREVAVHVDTYVMTRWALGKHWRTANDEQRKEIEDLFRQLLVQTYAAGLMQFTGEEVVVLNARKDKYGDILVRTEIISPKTPKPLPVNYRMRNDAGTLKAYDIIIEGISFLTTYRSSFDTLVKQSGIDGLITSLREKTRA
jgi:phospholipid transport system substrate-binding protein